MRFRLALFVWSMAIGGGAQASSFVVLEPLKDAVGPSMIVLGAPASMAERTPPEPDTAEPRVALSYPAPGGAPGPEAMRRVSPSIIALGQPIPEVARPGEYRICTGNAAVNFCTPIEIAAP